MLPGLDLVPDVSDNPMMNSNNSNSNETEGTGSTGSTGSDKPLSAAPTDSHNTNDMDDKKTNGSSDVHTIQLSAEERLNTIRVMQQKRGFKRQDSRYVGNIGKQCDPTKPCESTIKMLNPKKGKSRVDKNITKLRWYLDQFKQYKPDIELYHSFCFSRAVWEFVYNYFVIFAFPILIYREGMAGFKAREMLHPMTFWSWLAFWSGNIAFLISDTQTQQCFMFPWIMANVLTIAGKSVIATKYGYYPKTIFDEYKDEDRPISKDYVQSLHLAPGWVAQHPLTMAREFWMTEQRMGINLAKLSMSFRDTKAFDLKTGCNCACSGYTTTLDWFLPYIYVNINDGGEFLTGWKFLLPGLLLFLLSFYTIFARLLPYSQSDATVADCNAYCWVVLICIPWKLSWTLWGAWLWSSSMAIDFNRRYHRMKLSTHLLDPKRESFNTAQMRKTYKAQLFGTISKKYKAKLLKHLDLQTIDIYNADTIFAWSQFRACLYDVGRMFLQREEAYNGILILSAVLILFFFLYSLVSDTIVLVWEDFIITMLLAIFVLIPNLWTLSCGNSLNYQTEKQQKILCDRVVDMLHYEYDTKEKYPKWSQELTRGREMVEAVIDVLAQDAYTVTFLGINVDNSVLQLISTVIGVMLYLTVWLVYQKWIVGEDDDNALLETPSPNML